MIKKTLQIGADLGDMTTLHMAKGIHDLFGS